MKQMPTIQRKTGAAIERKTAQIKPRAGRGKIERLPVLETMFEDQGDPLEDVEYDPADLERSANAEMSEILKQIIEDKKALQDRFRVARDPDYWVALCFQSREQRDEFLEKTGWGESGTRFLNGLDISRRVGAEISPIELTPLPLRGKPSKYTEEEVI